MLPRFLFGFGLDQIMHWSGICQVVGYAQNRQSVARGWRTALAYFLGSESRRRLRKSESGRSRTFELMNILIESMTRIETPRFVVRVWRQENNPSPDDPTSEFRDKLAAVLNGWFESHLNLGEKILALENVNAVEVTDHLGQGFVLYKDWP